MTSEDTPRAWTFRDDTVAAKFDEHVRSQLSWYEPTAQYVADMAVNFLPKNGVLYDIGASTGNMTKLLADDIKAKGVVSFSIEPSHQMAKMWAGKGDLLVVEAEQVDFRARKPDCAILFLVLMFMLPERREAFMRSLLRSVTPGGAVFVVDKGFMHVPNVQIACKTALMAAKRRAGQHGDAWVTKELSLRGEQRPTDQEQLERIFQDEGFAYEQFFQMGEFYGYLAIRRTL